MANQLLLRWGEKDLIAAPCSGKKKDRKISKNSINEILEIHTSNNLQKCFISFFITGYWFSVNTINILRFITFIFHVFWNVINMSMVFHTTKLSYKGNRCSLYIPPLSLLVFQEEPRILLFHCQDVRIKIFLANWWLVLTGLFQWSVLTIGCFASWWLVLTGLVDWTNSWIQSMPIGFRQIVKL